MRRLAFLLLIVLAIVTFKVNAEAAQALDVYVIHSGNKKTVSLFSNYLARKLPNADVKSIELNHLNLPAINDGVLYVSLGARVFNYLLDKNVSAPILSVFLSSVSFNKSLSTREIADPLSVSAIYAEPDPTVLVRLAKILYPKNTQIAALLSEDTQFLHPTIEIAAKENKAQLITAYVGEESSLNKALNVISSADALLALADGTIYNTHTLRNILLTTYRHNQALIGFTEGMVKAGALASVKYDVEDVAADTLEFIASYRRTGKLPPPRFSARYHVLVNKNVAKTLGVAEKDPDVIHRQLRRSTSDPLDR